MQAPFAGDQQAREFRAVTEKDIIEKLSTVSPCAGCTTGAPAVIVAAYREDCMMPEYARIDLSIAMENLWLETDGQGFGGGLAGHRAIEARMRAVEGIVGLPAGVRRLPRGLSRGAPAAGGPF